MPTMFLPALLLAGEGDELDGVVELEGREDPDGLQHGCHAARVVIGSRGVDHRHLGRGIVVRSDDEHPIRIGRSLDPPDDIA